MDEKDTLSRILIWFRAYVAAGQNHWQVSNKIESQRVQMSRVQDVQSLTVPLSLPVSPQSSQQSFTWVFMSTASGPCPPSIWWVQVFARTLPHRQTLVSTDATMAALWRWGWWWLGVGGVSCFTAEESKARQWTGFPLSPASARMKPMSFKSRGGTDLCYGSSPLSGQAASLCSSLLETQPWLMCNKAFLSPSVCLEACFHLRLELEWWVSTWWKCGPSIRHIKKIKELRFSVREEEVLWP